MLPIPPSKTQGPMSQNSRNCVLDYALILISRGCKNPIKQYGLNVTEIVDDE